MRRRTVITTSRAESVDEGEPSVVALLIYALPGFGSGLPHFLLLMYLMKYATDVLRMSPAVFATILAASRVWDAVSDVGLGYLSDRTRTRFGRRRPWIFAGALALSCCVVAVWAVPASLSPAGLTVWMAAAIVIYFTAHTAVLVPYDGLGVELTSSHHGRTRVFAFRHVAHFLAMVAGIAAVGWITSTDAQRATGSTLGWIMGPLVLLSVLPLVARLREGEPNVAPRAPSPLRSLRDVAKNPHAMRIYTLLFIEAAGTNALSAMGPFVTAYLIGDESTLPYVIGAYVLGGLVAVPLVSIVSRWVGKRRVWSGSMLLTAGAFALLYLVSTGDVVLLACCAAAVGVGDCCAGVLGRSLLSDTIDHDQAQTGERKEALYFSVLSFTHKLSYGVTVALAGYALQAAGYSPDEASNPEVETVLRWALSVIPAGAYLIGFAISLGYRLDSKSHAEIRRVIDAGSSEVGD